jgi:HTH-type transcriptional regulator/antitoxin MqsA
MIMSAIKRPLPETTVDLETGETLRRGVRPLAVTYKGETIVVDTPGYYPEGDGDGLLIGDDMAPADEALRILKERVDGLPSPATIREIRAKLKLSQREAGELFKVGENAFDKYERGLVEPSGPTTQLMKLLSKHPELVDELRK